MGERETSRGPKEEGPRKPPTIPRVPPEEIEQFRKEHIAQLENNLAKAQEEYSKILSTDDYRKTARAIKNFEDGFKIVNTWKVTQIACVIEVEGK